ncbi:hypothetical protein PENTCL1PPCAC_28130 [Pristionchus entomophagus]|uniref:Ribosomal protein n=1 Tax=Pristionchus entomophagus TaxID=358040 RepID=A0AAV5UG27_9BILA|nr:hypothetical protein PENTCL1PPCAC_28130 [Pristionchus entomophagus]
MEIRTAARDSEERERSGLVIIVRAVYVGVSVGHRAQSHDVVDELTSAIVDDLHPAGRLTDLLVLVLGSPALLEADLDHGVPVHVVTADARDRSKLSTIEGPERVREIFLLLVAPVECLGHGLVVEQLQNRPTSSNEIEYLDRCAGVHLVDGVSIGESRLSVQIRRGDENGIARQDAHPHAPVLLHRDPNSAPYLGPEILHFLVESGERRVDHAHAVSLIPRIRLEATIDEVVRLGNLLQSSDVLILLAVVDRTPIVIHRFRFRRVRFNFRRPCHAYFRAVELL